MRRKLWGVILLILFAMVTIQVSPVAASTQESTASISFIDSSPVPHGSKTRGHKPAVKTVYQAAATPKARTKMPATGEVQNQLLLVLGLEVLVIVGLLWPKGGEADAQID
ncbi:LPXTG cell wall anchor domain-containing protein [Lacticaseibacillus salsurivasis]|uniref:LPXTG cell wall anchor domain-containing protein n=1 Tax=Lacticaseibacillus salsurivasis TaxID=3081441 RepID=UPI0030C76E39